MTRFLVLSRDALITSPADPRPFKTSVVFSFAEGPGQLFKALSVFALRDLDLYKVSLGSPELYAIGFGACWLVERMPAVLVALSSVMGLGSSE